MGAVQHQGLLGQAHSSGWDQELPETQIPTGLSGLDFFHRTQPEPLRLGCKASQNLPVPTPTPTWLFPHQSLHGVILGSSTCLWVTVYSKLTV